jgi:hypothetical protein
MINQNYVDYEGVKLKFEYSFLMNGEVIQVVLKANPFISIDQKFIFPFSCKNGAYMIPYSNNLEKGEYLFIESFSICPQMLRRIEDIESKLPNTLYKGLNHSAS